eukprot:UN20945
MFDGCAISLYFLDHFDPKNIFKPKNDSKFLAKLYQFSFYVSGTVDNLTATSSPIQIVLENKRPGDDKTLQKHNYKCWLEVSGKLLSEQLGEP